MNTTELSLIAAVNHATDTLGLYRAELARILGLKCPDVSDARTLALLFETDTTVQRSGASFVRFYILLEEVFQADTVQMINWFRRDNSKLGTTPFLAMVDHGQLDHVVTVLQHTVRHHP